MVVLFVRGDGDGDGGDIVVGVVWVCSSCGFFLFRCLIVGGPFAKITPPFIETSKEAQRKMFTGSISYELNK